MIEPPVPATLDQEQALLEAKVVSLGGDGAGKGRDNVNLLVGKAYTAMIHRHPRAY